MRIHKITENQLIGRTLVYTVVLSAKWDSKQGRHAATYKFKLPDGRVLFEGNGFFPSPFFSPSPLIKNPEGKRAAMELLFFLCLQPGDTDEEYFKNYTPEQKAWCESQECEMLGYVVSDYEEKHGIR